MTPVRVRFAPSPTGLLHVGGARTAIFNYFFAKHHGGQFILRIEDTDTERSRKEWEDEILQSMQWLGLKWDEGPFYQTKRFDDYRAYAHKLLEAGHAYRCTCTTEELTEMRAVAEAAGRKPMYDRRCRDKKSIEAGKPFVVRFKTPLAGEVVVKDLIRGDVHFANEECDDFIILRSNDTPTYNFTVVVDDIDMRISHVIRGDDHLSNTPKQILIMQALGWTPPAFAHVPMILAPDKTKLSKRHGAVAVSQFRTEGYLPEAMVNTLVRLGWSKGDQEIFSYTELAASFDLDACGVSGSVFDRSKLDSLNAHYLRQRSPESLAAILKQDFQFDVSALLASPGGLKLFLALRERAVRLPDLIAGTKWYFTDTVERDPASVAAALTEVKAGAVETLTELLRALPDADFVAEKIAPLFKEAAAKIGGKMPDVAKPARVLLTGTLQSPDIGLVVEALGKTRTLARLNS
ncbi:MAG: glutamate--tRNA ligase [Bdellovibrionales bacterium]|nr:glutamate--tRNA ligase [Bdellovibrionales bacterium]